MAKKTWHLSINVGLYEDNNGIERVNLSESFTLKANSFVEIALIADRFHKLGELIQEEQKGITVD